MWEEDIDTKTTRPAPQLSETVIAAILQEASDAITVLKGAPDKASETLDMLNRLYMHGKGTKRLPQEEFARIVSQEMLHIRDNIASIFEMSSFQLLL